MLNYVVRGVAAGPSNSAEDIVQDPHVALRNMLIKVPRPDSEEPLLVVGNPVKLSHMSEGPVRRFPCLGEHTDALLNGLLGLPQEQLESLRESGVIGPTPSQNR